MNDLKHFTTCDSFTQNYFRFESQRKKTPQFLITVVLSFDVLY